MNEIVKKLSWEDCEKLASEMAGSIRGCVSSSDARIGVFGVPRGGWNVAQLLPQVDSRFYLCESPEKSDIIVDDLIDSGRTKKKYEELYRKPFFVLYEKSEEEDWVVFPWENNSDTGPEENIVRILQYIGENPNREGLLETPKRIVKSYDRLFGGYKQNPDDIMKTFTEGACDEMVVLKDIQLFSTCEHHMLPFFGKAHVAYIPNGKVIGVSKLARLVDLFARRMQIQERLGSQVVDCLMEKLDAKGAACVIEAQHFCMISRGVENQTAVMKTSALRGVFRDDARARAEFLQMIR